MGIKLLRKSALNIIKMLFFIQTQVVIILGQTHENKRYSLSRQSYSKIRVTSMNQSQDTKTYNSEMYRIAVGPLRSLSSKLDWKGGRKSVEEKIQKKVEKKLSRSSKNSCQQLLTCSAFAVWMFERLNWFIIRKSFATCVLQIHPKVLSALALVKKVQLRFHRAEGIFKTRHLKDYEVQSETEKTNK